MLTYSSSESQSTPGNYGRPLMLRLILSASLIFFCSFGGPHLIAVNWTFGGQDLFWPMFSMLGGLGPLVQYHLHLYYQGRQYGLSSGAIDSVYYFGFLITILALASSALEVALGGDKLSLMKVTLQFGLGLLATGYAVFARITLMDQAGGTPEQSAEDVFDTYLTKSRDLVNNFDAASSAFAYLSETIQSKTEEAVARSLELLQQQLSASMLLFQQEVQNTLASAKDSATELKQLLDAANFEEERKLLAKSIKSTITSLDKLNDSFGKLEDKAQMAGNAVESVQTGLSGLEASAQGVQQKFSAIQSCENPLDKHAEAYERATQAIEKSTKQVVNLQAYMDAAVTGLEPLPERFRKVTDEFLAFESATPSLQYATGNLTAAGQALHQFLEQAVKAGSAFTPLENSLAKLVTEIQHVRSQSQSLEQTLDTIPKQASAVLGLAQDVEQAGLVLRTVAQETAQGIHTLFTSLGGMEQLVGSSQQVNQECIELGNHLSTLKDAARQAGHSLQLFETGINDSGHRTTSGLDQARRHLEQNVESSSIAVVNLTRGLTDLMSEVTAAIKTQLLVTGSPVVETSLPLAEPQR